MGKQVKKTIKLVALIDTEDGGFNARVHPVLIDTKHPLAAIREPNAVVVEGENINQLVFSGPAGSAPTASAVIGDVLSLHLLNFQATSQTGIH